MPRARSSRPGSWGGSGRSWKEDPRTRREYLRIYQEVEVFGLPARVIAQDKGISRSHVYEIVRAVKESGLI